MPARGHATAPVFDGDPLNLRQFFDEIDSLATGMNLSDSEKIRHTLQYARCEDYELWMTLPKATLTDFANF